MQWLFHSKSKDIPMKGLDWIMLSANAVGIAIVTAATLSAQSHQNSYAENEKPAPMELASLD